jgi:hypothetical protein
MIKYASETKIIKLTTNEGFKGKLYINILLDEDKRKVIVLRKVFFSVHKNLEVAIMLKKLGNVNLYEQSISFKEKTLQDVIEAINSICRFNKRSHDKRSKETD